MSLLLVDNMPSMRRAKEEQRGGEGMIRFLKRAIGALMKEKPAMRIVIKGRFIDDTKKIIAEMNREYGDSHTLYIEVTF